MVNPSANPFVLPGFGQSGDLAQNPMMASLEMMRQAWQNMAGGALDHSLMAAPMSPEELERRIKDLRAVENWLRMNLSMLSSTIQGLEVQKATLSTLRSFVATASASGGSAAEALSPLEVVLGIRKPGQAAPAPAAPVAPSASAWPESPAKSAAASGAAQASAAPAPEVPKASAASAAEAAGTPGDAALASAAAAAQGWWDMLQKQFDTLAAATSATLQSAEAMKTPAARTETPAAASATPAGTASDTPAPSARRSVAKKAVPRKTTARKTAAK